MPSPFEWSSWRRHGGVGDGRRRRAGPEIEDDVKNGATSMFFFFDTLYISSQDTTIVG
jgi:hypothetical protein